RRALRGDRVEARMRGLIEITSAEDPRIESYLEIRERDLRGRGDRFVVEGEVVLRVAAAAPLVRLESALLLVSRLGPLADLLPALTNVAPVYVAARGVLDAIAGFAMHRGILAIGRRNEPADARALLDRLPGPVLVMGLIGIANHDNMGSLFRNAAAFGVDAVLLDEACCDPLYRKAIRVAAGGALLVPFARAGSVETLAATLAEAGLDILATSPGGHEGLAEISAPRRAAVLFGAEGSGLPSTLLRRLRSLRVE